MAVIDDLLEEIEVLISNVKPAEAQERLRGLLVGMGPAELKVWETELREVIDKFLPKRRRELALLLDDRLRIQADPEERLDEVVDIQAAVEDFRYSLDELSQHHIFQWSTSYRDYLQPCYNSFIESSSSPHLLEAVRVVGGEVARHSQDIFSKGYYHVTRRESESHAVAKSISGLSRFLDLPIEFYSARLSSDLNRHQALGLRYLTSAMLSGIINGYSRVEFGSVLGRQILGENLSSWAYILAFMGGDEAKQVLDSLEDEEFRHGAIAAVVPLAKVFDGLIAAVTDYIPLPALSQLLWSQRRLEISLRPPPFTPDRRPVQIQCYLDPGLVSDDSLSEAVGRGVGTIIAPLTHELRNFVADHEDVDRVLVPVFEDDGGSGVAMLTRLESVLGNAIYRRHTPIFSARPLDYNFAREFPLQNPFLTRYYYVVRTTVRDLLRTFERRNGVRLWCSVRRSGKTTAGIDLGTTTGHSNVIPQTCDDTGQFPGGSLLYDLVCDALATGSQLPRNFLTEAVGRCMSNGQSQDRRTVLVLDEYETLFGRLSTAVDYDRRLRYTVVQPLLNQMVAFAQDNLLVFLGQQPTAHSILMDQNQLSAYVQQDSFPLFWHDIESEGSGEFSELLGKVLSNRVSFDRSFVDRVFVETAGHPYLTVNVLVDFVDWLIRSKRPISNLFLTANDFSRFASAMFRRDRIIVSPEYRFFRDAAIPQALGMRGKSENPWLYAIYSVLKMIAIENPDSFICSRPEFSEIVKKLGLEQVGITPEYLLTTGSQANFLSFTERSVTPRIRILARIAAVSTPSVMP